MDAKNAAWAAVANNINPAAIRDLNEKCLAETPDTEKVVHKFTSYALNVALALSHLMEFITDHQISHIHEISNLATDSVDAFVTASEGAYVYTAELDRKVSKDPLLKAELWRQKEDLDFLDGLVDSPQIRALARLKDRAQRQMPLLP